MAQNLKNLTATHVALVDRAANQEADVVLFKRDTEPLTLERIGQSFVAVIGKMYDQNGVAMPEPAQTFDQVVAEIETATATAELHDAVCPLLGALREAVHSIIDDPEAAEKATLIRESADQFMAELKDALIGKGMIGKAATKTEAGAEYPAAAYAYVPDANKPSTWKLRLWESPDKKETTAQVGRAVAALGKGFRGNRVQIPAADMAAVKAKVRAAWRKTNPDKSAADIPEVLKGENTMDKTITQEQFDILQAQVVAATAKVDLLTKAVADEKARTGTAEAALKTANEELAKHAPAKSDLEKRLDALPEEIAKGFRAEIQALRKDVDESRELREVAKFEKMAIDDYPNLPGKENGRILKAIHGLTDEDTRKAALELFKGANEAYRLMFKEQGRTHTGAHSAAADLEHRAKELMKADSTLSYHQAVLKAGDSDPALTERLYEEQKERPRA